MAAVQLVAAPCEVITNGPAVPFTVTNIKSDAVCPPPTLLSLTINEKFIVLATEGVTSQVEANVLLITVANAGIYLFGEIVGLIDLYNGPVA